jgi:transposase
LPETLNRLKLFTKKIGINMDGSALTLDSGFDSNDNKIRIKSQKLTPVICPNRRNTKNPIKLAQKFRWFKKKIYKERYKIERTFAWQDTYRRIVVSYDRLKKTRTGFRNLAYAMINFRVTFDSS